MCKKRQYASSIFVIFFLLSTLIFFPSHSTVESSELDSSSRNLDPPRLFGNATEDGIELEWSFSDTDPVEVEKFRIFRSLSSSFKLLYEEVEEGTSTYLDEDVESGRTYSYWLTAWFEEGEETGFSRELEIKAEGKNEPLPPRNLRAFPGDSRVRLRWDEPLDPDVTDISHYRLYRGEEGEEALSERPKNLAREFEEEGLENGEEYTYRLMAENNEGESEAVKITAVPTDDLPLPETPSDFDVFLGEEEVELKWEPPENGDSVSDYRLYRDGEVLTDDDDEDIKIPSDTHYFVDDEVEMGEVYNYSISSLNVDGKESNRSGDRQIRVEEGRYLLSIEENVEDITEKLDEGLVSERYRERYEDEGYSLSDDEYISITVEEEGKRWRLHDEGEGHDHRIRKEDETLKISEDRKSSPEGFQLESGDQKVTISWAPPSDEKDEDIRYNIYRGTEEGDMTFLTQVEDGFEYTDEGLENGKVYHYNVRAVGPRNVLGNSTATWHSVPMEEDEEGFSTLTLIGYAVVIAIGVLAILAVIKRREPEGPNPWKKKKE